MQIIVITRPAFYPDEARDITQLFEAGLQILHLRKPEATLDEMVNLLNSIPKEYHPRIVLHEHFALTANYQVRGIHLNRRNPEVPAGYVGAVSRSCHSLEEVERYKSSSNYLFLSPIYDSISKEGYGAAFPKEVLRAAHAAGIIDSKIYALGGITAEHLPEVASWGFGGAAFLGDIWHREPHERVEYLKQMLQ